ncbi:LysR family transcriptional regulator [Paenibacillus sp. N1-5-1-14]|uniref:LysR family transcriptional regulator n=1 Tax=Paenibacillus radicibacter TaxID=2972488 RepID=UPI00215984D2|nr:LysR family transcriptional regulator [Paenibacillus radicibacter]MCR8644301.1 LysR family transcriptional regulator [Paenibacillus radicibacter]
MGLQQLYYFKRVAELESMSLTADALHIDQPTLSKMITRLEENLGVPLFERVGRRIRLNPYGKRYLVQVDKALEALEYGRKEVQDLAKIDRQRVKVAMPLHNDFANEIAEYMQMNPDAKLQVVQASELEQVKQLRSGGLDLCITSTRIDEPDVEAVSFFKEQILLAVPSTHRFAARSHIQLKEAAFEPFIGLHKSNPLREMTDMFCKQAGFAPYIIHEVDEHKAIEQWVQTGVGIAFVPESHVEQFSSKLTVITIEQPICIRNYQLAWRKDRYMSQDAKHLQQYILSGFSSKFYITAR